MGYEEITSKEINSIVFLADIHFGVRANSLDWQDNIKTYFYKHFIPYVKDLQKITSSALIIAGDYFENRQIIDINVLNIGMDIMQELSNILPVYMVIGNHDIYKERDIDVNSLKVFNCMPNVHVIDKITVMEICGGARIMMIPWVGDKKAEGAILKRHHDNADIFVMHSELSGMSMDNGRPITDGVDTDCVNDKLVVSGHIHTRQERGHLLYLGSPYQTKRSDMGNVKGVYNFQFKKDGTFEKYFTPNNTSPIFMRLKIMDYLETPIGEIEKLLYNNYVDVVVPKVYKNEITSTKILDAFSESGVKKIGVVSEKTSDTVVENEEHTMGKKNVSIRSVFESKLDSMGFGDKDKTALNKLNETYIAKAIEELNYTEEI